MPDDRRPPEGAPRFAVFDGILEGPVGGAERLTGAALALRRLDIVDADLDIDGGRFCWLPADGRVAGAKLTVERQSALLDALGALVAASADPTRVESTLRCTMVYEDQVVETLFSVQRGAVSSLSRVRTASDADAMPELPAGRRGLRRLGNGQLTLLASLLALALGAIAWQVGLVAQVFGPAPGELATDSGPLDRAVTIDVRGGLGTYRVTLRRGTDYPATPGAIDTRLAAATTTADRALLARLMAGASIDVQLEDAEGRVLARSSCSLAPLLEDHPSEAVLPRRLAAREVSLAFGRGD